MERKLLKSVNYFRNAEVSTRLRKGFLVGFFCCFVLFGGVGGWVVVFCCLGFCFF